MFQLSDAIYSTSLTVSLIPRVEMSSFHFSFSLSSPPFVVLVSLSFSPEQTPLAAFIEFCLFYLPHDSREEKKFLLHPVAGSSRYEDQREVGV
jgi:hypothetical protein